MNEIVVAVISSAVTATVGMLAYLGKRRLERRAAVESHERDEKVLSNIAKYLEVFERAQAQKFDMSQVHLEGIEVSLFTGPIRDEAIDYLSDLATVGLVYSYNHAVRLAVLLHLPDQTEKAYETAVDNFRLLFRGGGSLLDSRLSDETAEPIKRFYDLVNDFSEERLNAWHNSLGMPSETETPREDAIK